MDELHHRHRYRRENKSKKRTNDPEKCKWVSVDGVQMKNGRNAERETLEFEKLRLRDITWNSCIMNLGPRESGKSFLTISQMLAIRPAKYVVFTGSTVTKKNPYVRILPDGSVIQGFPEECLRELIDAQKKLCTENNLDFQTMSKDEIKDAMKEIGLMVILDDLSQDESIYNSSIFKELIFNGKHYGIFVIVNVHFATCVSYRSRDQFQYVFATLDTSIKNCGKLYDYFFGCFPNIRAFTKVYRELAVEFRVMVKKPNIKSWELHDSVCWFKADKTRIEKFLDSGNKLGHPDFF